MHISSPPWACVLILALVALCLPACSTSPNTMTPEPVAPAPTTPAVFLLASLNIDDFDAFMSGYGAKAPPTVLKAGGEVYAATPTVEVQEGSYSQNWTVLIRFPSAEAANAWYASPEYQEAIPLRQEVTDPETSRLLFAPAFAPEPQGNSEGAMYMFASLKVSDFDALMSDYGAAAGPTVASAGGEVVIATPEVTVLEGTYTQNWTVVLRFPSAMAAQQWYQSEEYQAAIPKRRAITDPESSWLMFVPAFAP